MVFAIMISEKWGVENRDMCKLLVSSGCFSVWFTYRTEIRRSLVFPSQCGCR